MAHPERTDRSRRQVILVVSPGLEPSRSPLVANLAAAYGESGATALVVSIGNLAWRRTRAVPGPELPSDGTFGPADIVPRATQSHVAGVSGLRFDQLLQSRSQVVAQGPAIIEAARDVADVIIVEGPPLLAAHDAIALLPAVDVVLLVAEYAFTRSDQAREAGDLLRRFRAPLLGVALTNVPRKGEDFIRIGVDELDDRVPAALAGPVVVRRASDLTAAPLEHPSTRMVPSQPVIALAIAAFLVLVTVPIARKVAATEQDPGLYRIIMVAVVVHLFFTVIQVWVVDHVYHGITDYTRYVDQGATLAHRFDAFNFSLTGTNITVLGIGCRGRGGRHRVRHRRRQQARRLLRVQLARLLLGAAVLPGLRHHLPRGRSSALRARWSSSCRPCCSGPQGSARKP